MRGQQREGLRGLGRRGGTVEAWARIFWAGKRRGFKSYLSKLGNVGGMARTAVLGAGFNVKINLESIKDQEYVDRIGKEVAELEKQAIEQEKKILAQAQVSRSAVE